MKRDDCLVYGKVSFRNGACENMSFKDFEKAYGDKLRKFDLKVVYRDLGGKVRAAKKVEEPSDKE